MSRKFSDSQVELAKLAFPLFGNTELSKHIGCSVVWLEKLAQKHNLKKMDYCFVPGQEGYPLDLTGYRFDKLTVLNKTNYKSKNNMVWHCQCTCGNTIKYKAAILRKRLKSDCGRCNKKIKEDSTKNKVTLEVTINNWAWSKIVSHAKERGISIEVDLDFAAELFIKQNKKCALSGLDIEFPKIIKNYKSGTASLDRKDSSIPYTKDNVQWIHKDINFMKWKHDQDYFVGLCKKIVDFQESKENN